MLQVLQFIVHTDQSCSVPGRNSIHNTRLLNDIVSDLNSRYLSGVDLLDQEKAFDWVDWPYGLRILRWMSIGSIFRQWSKFIYSHISSSVLVNGTQSAFFSVTKGVRQDCPPSQILYITIPETLACAIPANSYINGFLFPHTRRVKICLYTDDTSFISLSNTTLLEVFSVLECYEQASGAKVNTNKSHSFFVGSWVSRQIHSNSAHDIPILQPSRIRVPNFQLLTPSGVRRTLLSWPNHDRERAWSKYFIVPIIFSLSARWCGFRPEEVEQAINYLSRELSSNEIALFFHLLSEEFR